MSLEQRVLSRWKEWWADKHNPPADRLLLQLIAIALEEVKKGMTEPRFTVKEAIALEHLISSVQAFVSPSLPMTSTKRVEAISKLITPETLSALGKLHMELDDLRQAQEMATGLGAIAPTTETTTGGEGRVNHSDINKVFRIPPTKKTAIYLVALDKSLTFTARGIFAYLRFSSEPVTLAELMNQCIVSGLTPRGVERILQELLDSGFVQLIDQAIASDTETATKGE